MYEMSRRFGDEDAFTAVGAIGKEKNETEELEHVYTEEELNMLDAAEANASVSKKNWRSWSVSLAESRKHINEYAYGDNPTNGILLRTSLPKIWRKSNAGAMNGRRQSKRTGYHHPGARKKPYKSNVPIPLPKYEAERKRA
jgi:hypothetical protein